MASSTDPCRQEVLPLFSPSDCGWGGRSSPFTLSTRTLRLRSLDAPQPPSLGASSPSRSVRVGSDSEVPLFRLPRDRHRHLFAPRSEAQASGQSDLVGPVLRFPDPLPSQTRSSSLLRWHLELASSESAIPASRYGYPVGSLPGFFFSNVGSRL